MVLLPGGFLPLAGVAAQRYHHGEQVAVACHGHEPGKEACMATQERLLVDARGTWKPYRVAYEVITAPRPLESGSVVEVSTKNDQAC